MKRLPFFPIVLSFVCSFVSVTFAAEWYRGHTHMHSYWSDGNVFPEQAIQWYKDHGYRFVCLSDHNLMQTDPDRWVAVGDKSRHTQEVFDDYLRRYGNDWVETKEKNGKTLFRLKTWPEFKRKLDEPGRFLVIPGQEINGKSLGLEAHGNSLNTTETITFDPGTSPSDSFRIAAGKVRRQGKEQGREVLYVQNHHNWRYFDIEPSVLIERSEIRFFEVCNANSGPMKPVHEKFWDLDKFWDIVLAHRLEKGDPILYGLASDDTHLYTKMAPKPGREFPGHGWIVVRAERLEPDEIVRAMKRGDFYASTGVELEDVSFDKGRKTLSVRVRPEPGVRYAISFRTTKKGFDKTTRTADDPARGKKPARTVTVYSDEIGRVVKTVDGTDASCTMEDDDLYIRATIVSDKPAVHPGDNEPPTGTAWTQPFTP